MVLDESGICRLCGSEEKVGVGSTDTQDTDGSVDMPFGLGQMAYLRNRQYPVYL